MKHKILKTENAMPAILFVLLLIYLAGIIWVNSNGELWYNLDMYYDAAIARCMVEQKNIFPQDWVFGNQTYVIATPVLAAFFYYIFHDTVLALSLASSMMTLLVLWAFCWCIRPFVRGSSLLAGALCLMGGTLFSRNAATDIQGLQLLFTMASYYACYLLGILVTVGLWLRLGQGQKVSRMFLIIGFLMNFFLGMQSLREMLVLNLPLCAVSAAQYLWERRNASGAGHAGNMHFPVVMLFANGLGLLLMLFLVHRGLVSQDDMLSAPGTNIVDNIRTSFGCLAGYAGWVKPDGSPYSLFRFTSVCVVLAAVLYSLADILIKHRSTPLAQVILFCGVSVVAVFCAGVVCISPRPKFYFVWHLLQAFSFVYVTDAFSENKRFRMVPMVVLAVIASFNFRFQFSDTIMKTDEEAVRKECQQVTDELLRRNITHIYIDTYTAYHAPKIAACSDDELIAVSVILNQYVPDMNDLLSPVRFLHSRSWFQKEHLQNSYVVLTKDTLDALSPEWLSEYREKLFSNLHLEYEAAIENKYYYFYSFTEMLFEDMKQ